MKFFCIAGTRPEFIKMFPVFWALKKKSEQEPSIQVKWVNTSQHQDLLEDLEIFFDLKADFNFEIKDSPDPNTRLGDLSSQVLSQATKLFNDEKPDLVFVQGDTLTAQSCALAAFYQKTKVAHIEAGLRTSDIHNPFPEELSRRIISQIAVLNFSPELTAQENLETEKKLYSKSSYNFYTGNTVIDTLGFSMDKINQDSFKWDKFSSLKQAFNGDNFDIKDYLANLSGKKYILITAHRRENLEIIDGSTKLDNLINSIKKLLDDKSTNDFEFIIMVHKNPQVKELFAKLDKHCKEIETNRVTFLDGANYPSFLELMKNCHFIVTDSGGIQEEAPYLKKPVLIFREHTERLAGLELGLSKLVGTKESAIHDGMLSLVNSTEAYKEMTETGLQPYGDGLAASRIVDSSLLYLSK